jgi:hypothetical protein
MVRSDTDRGEVASAANLGKIGQRCTTDDQLRAPRADVAEEIVVGGIVLSAGGAELARSRLDPSDFYQPAFGRLLKHAGELPRSPLEVRITVAAEISGLAASQVEKLVNVCPTLTDATGRYARRVKNSRLRREIQRRTLDIARDAPQVGADELIERIDAAASRAAEVAKLAGEERSWLPPLGPGGLGAGIPALGVFVNRRTPGAPSGPGMGDDVMRAEDLPSQVGDRNFLLARDVTRAPASRPERLGEWSWSVERNQTTAGRRKAQSESTAERPSDRRSQIGRR